MYQTLLGDSSLYTLLLKFDEELAAKVKAQGCPCGGKLHNARYPRKPRGIPAAVNDSYSTRESFCCAQEGCRRRRTPPSLRFLGRKVYVGAVVVLVTALRHGTTPVRLAKLRELVGVNARTVERWREWWQTTFVRSRFWKVARARLKEPVDEGTLPLSLLEAFEVKEEKKKLVCLLQFISPVTTSWAIQAF